MIVNFCRNRK